MTTDDGSSGTTGDTLVIVGSGPVGMVAALLLRDRFERVVLFERQSKERFLTTRGFTFPIVFSPATINVLQRAGAWEAIASERSPYFGVVVHTRLLGRSFPWKAKRAGVYSHWRNHIIASLYDRVCAAGIEVRFEANVEAIDFNRNICTEAELGEVPFDLLLGADGINSITRRLMGEAHPGYTPDRFRSVLLDRWFAYRLPSEGTLAERFGGGEGHYAANIYVDNHRQYPDDKVRLITVAMKQPRDEISVVVKYGADLSLDRVREINDAYMAPLVDAEVLDREWNKGFGGKYEHVEVPTFHLHSVLLVGDAAHGFEGNGDAINMGIGSVGSLPGILAAHDDIPQALAAYDATVGRALRQYSDYAMRRSMEKINFEVVAFEAGALLRLNKHHPSMWGIYEDDFEIEAYMKGYERHRRRIYGRLAGLSAAAVSAGAVLTRLSRRRRA